MMTPLIRTVLLVQHQSSVNKEGACGDIQKAAAHTLARHQGAVAAGLAAISKENVKRSMPKTTACLTAYVVFHGMRAILYSIHSSFVNSVKTCAVFSHC